MNTRTSLQGIARTAKADRQRRFQDLSRLLTEEWLRECWRDMNKRAAIGVDRISPREYEKNLEANVEDLVRRLKRGSYRAKLVRRKNIPKGKGKTRPLGILVVEDKLLQLAVAKILMAIFEQDFLPCSFGFRPGRGSREAVSELSRELQFGKYGYIVDADVKGYFDAIDHEILVHLLEERIDDQRFLRLIRKWLRAGVLEEDGKVTHPQTGCPQGGIISPVLANIFLHRVLDRWFEETVRTWCRGQAYVIRYADDFVCAFQYKAEAEGFYVALQKRMARAKLELSQEKTKIIRFSRFQLKPSKSFSFLGFEYRWMKDRKGKPRVKRKTQRKKFRASLKRFQVWVRTHRSMPLRKLMPIVNMKLRGHYNYYGVRGNYLSLREFFRRATEILFKWLNRRSQRRSYRWSGFRAMLAFYRIERPHITEKPKRQLILYGFC